MGVFRVHVRALDGHLAIGQQEDGHTLLLDRPKETGGSGLGFNGGHLMLLGWAACFKSTLLAAAEGRGIEVQRLELNAVGQTESTHGLRFVSLQLDVDLEIDGDQRQREHLVELADKGCAVSNALRREVPLEIALTSTHETAAHQTKAETTPA